MKCRSWMGLREVVKGRNTIRQDSMEGNVRVSKQSQLRRSFVSGFESGWCNRPLQDLVDI
jgi:hypothetical protein